MEAKTGSSYTTSCLAEVAAIDRFGRTVIRVKAVVLCAGEGTRMRPFSYSQPKHLLPIANRPVIEWILETISLAGISEIAVVVSPSTESAFREALGDGRSLGVSLSYVVQETARGLAHAVACAESYVSGEAFLLYLGDNLFERGVQGLVDVFEEDRCSAAISLVSVEDPRRFGVASVEDGKIAQLVEKPEHPPSNLAIAGGYVFGPVIFDAIRQIKPSARGELEITDAIQKLISDGRRVVPHEVGGWWKDVGQPRDMITANELLVALREPSVEGRIDGGSVIEGHVEVSRDAMIEASTIRGPAVIGSGTEVRNAVVGPNVSVGDGCVIEDCRIEQSIVMDGATIRGAGNITWSIIGRYTEIAKVAGSSFSGLLLGDDGRVLSE